MNWLEFWSTIARSLVWPIVVLILAYWFRDSIKAAIPRLSKVKGGGFEAEFERKLEEVVIEVAKDKLFETVEPFSEFQREKYRQLIEVTPALGVTEAWTDVDFALRPLLGSKVSTSQIIDQKVLEESGLFNDTELHVFNSMRELRNQISHAGGSSITAKQAEDYTKLARQMIALIHHKMKSKLKDGASETAT